MFWGNRGVSFEVFRVPSELVDAATSASVVASFSVVACSGAVVLSTVVSSATVVESEQDDEESVHSGHNLTLLTIQYLIPSTALKAATPSVVTESVVLAAVAPCVVS